MAANVMPVTANSPTLSVVTPNRSQAEQAPATGVELRSGGNDNATQVRVADPASAVKEQRAVVERAVKDAEAQLQDIRMRGDNGQATADEITAVVEDLNTQFGGLADALEQQVQSETRQESVRTEAESALSKLREETIAQGRETTDPVLRAYSNAMEALQADREAVVRENNETAQIISDVETTTAQAQALLDAASVENTDSNREAFAEMQDSIARAAQMLQSLPLAPTEFAAVNAQY